MRTIPQWLGIRQISTVAFVLVLAMCLFPPWRIPVPQQGVSVNVGFSFLFSPPHQVAEIDAGRLFLQIFVVALIAVGLVAMVRLWGKQAP